MLPPAEPKDVFKQGIAEVSRFNPDQGCGHLRNSEGEELHFDAAGIRGNDELSYGQWVIYEEVIRLDGERKVLWIRGC